jgi:hypothetical protein
MQKLHCPIKAPNAIAKIPGLEFMVVPRICGIYFLVNRGKIMYVGQSVHIISRVIQHTYGKKALFDDRAVFFLRCEKEELNDEEERYINMFRPPLNKLTTKSNPESARNQYTAGKTWNASLERWL